jgi:hypothetical protein
MSIKEQGQHYQDTLKKLVDSVKQKTEDMSLNEELRNEYSEVGMHGLILLGLFDNMELMPNSEKETFFESIKPNMDKYIELCNQIPL